MDPSSLATSIIGILMPYVSKTASDFISTAGEVAYSKAKSIFAKLKDRWTGDQEASRALEGFQHKPDRYQLVLQDVLGEKLSQDGSLAGELRQMVEELGPSLQILMKAEELEDGTGLESRELRSGRIGIEQDVRRGTKLIGAKIDRIG
ncbi:hypothetical protein F0U60_15180 [Archangium minus]|uniref:Uncharacterized protein n=1 Tax=Archangium minus TaxID=83450 RepID=A0ABY9WS62_9BACT|nr:hypothetical protein F0U60_15180 [Archangium minus]